MQELLDKVCVRLEKDFLVFVRIPFTSKNYQMYLYYDSMNKILHGTHLCGEDIKLWE